jgi:hypothetical protein
MTLTTELRAGQWRRDQVRGLCERAADELDRLQKALDESVKLQSHYASLLNQYDGGRRLQFKNAQEWIERLDSLADTEMQMRALSEGG